MDTDEGHLSYRGECDDTQTWLQLATEKVLGKPPENNSDRFFIITNRLTKLKMRNMLT